MFGTPQLADAQQVSLSTNLLTWANFGTTNLDAAVSVSKNFTVHAGAKYNPWEFRTKSQVTILNQQITGYVGAKYWPWHVYSEWWVGAKFQYKNFEQVGLLSPNLRRGDAVGGGLAGGYTFLVGRNFNVDVGLGLWGGRLLRYREYEGNVAVDSKLIDIGPRNFMFLDNVMIALVYIF